MARISPLAIVTGVSLTAVAGLTATVVVMSNSNKNTEQNSDNTQGSAVVQESQKRDTLLTEDNFEDLMESLSKDAEENANQGVPQVPTNYTVSMSTKWTFADGEAISEDAYFDNFMTNTTPVYVDIIRNDTNEVIYQSPVIPVGSGVHKVKLDKDLEPGDYECTLIYYLIDEDQNVLTDVKMWLMINVLG